MSRSHKRRYLASPVLLAVVTLGALAIGQAAPAVAGPASASARPRVSFSFKNNRIRSTQRPVVRYTSANLPFRSKLELQRQFGTARVWKNVVLLKGRSGTQSVPAVQMGRYRYRVNVTHRSSTVVVSATKLLYSYGRVTLADLCNEPSTSIIVHNTNCNTQTVQVGEHIFTYLIEDSPPGWPNTNTEVTVSAKTSCRTISIQFALDNNANSQDLAYVQVVQTSSDPQSKSVGTGAIGDAYFSLDGGPWYLNIATSNAYNDNEYVNAYLSCWSLNGLG
jgi:hypothetical protein